MSTNRDVVGFSQSRTPSVGPVPGLGGVWQVQIQETADKRKLWPDLPGLLQQCPKGLFHIDHVAANPFDSNIEVARKLKSLGVRWAWFRAHRGFD